MALKKKLKKILSANFTRPHIAEIRHQLIYMKVILLKDTNHIMRIIHTKGKLFGTMMTDLAF